MSKVTIVANKKTGLLYQPTSSGKMYRVQVSSQESGETLDSNGNGTGMNFSRKLVGFSYHQTKQACEDLIASAVNGVIPGKVIYVDQLTPITEEAVDYGKQYPYPFRFNGKDLSLEQRLAIQAACVEAKLPLMQSGKPIYRKKIHTTHMESKSVILSPDNLDDINKFIATMLAANASPRLAELKTLIADPKTSAADKKKYKVELAGIED